MRERPESHSEISGAIKRRSRDLNERVDHLGLVVGDKKTVCDAAKRLHLATTAEGADEISRAIADAAKATEDEFRRQNADAEAALVQCQQAVQDLHRRRKDASQNEATMKSTADGTREAKEARAHVARGKNEAGKDAHFLGGAAKSQSDGAQAADRRRQQEKLTLLNTTLGAGYPSDNRELGDIIGETDGSYGTPPPGAGKSYAQQLAEMVSGAGDKGRGRMSDIGGFPPDRLEDGLTPLADGEGDVPDQPQKPPLPMDGKGYINEVITYKNKKYK